MIVLGVVPARGGSKGIPEKNLREIAGRPLLAWTADAAAASGVLDRVILTTDDESIADVGSRVGLEVPFLRPAELADDDTPMIDVVINALDELRRNAGYEPDVVALLQPTSPHRRPEHIRTALNLLDDGVDSVCAVSQLPAELSPHYIMRLDDEGFLDHFLLEGREIRRRQDAPAAYKRNGVIYLTRTAVIYRHRDLYGDRCVPLILPWEDAVTLDEEGDWRLMESRLIAEASGGESPPLARS